MWPLNVAMDVGGHLLTLATVSPGNPWINCFWMAVLKDGSGGDPSVAWEN